MANPEHLQRLLGQPPLQRLIERLRRRFESGGNSQGTITLNDASTEERAAIERLLGRPPGKGGSLQIRLPQLENIIRHSGAAEDLHSAIAALSGPLRNRRAENTQIQEKWQHLFERIRCRADELNLMIWLDQLQSSGLLKRLAQQNLAKAEQFLEQALRVVAVLPQQGQSLSTLAANALGDAHALDQGKPVATLVKKAVPHLLHSEVQTLTEYDEESTDNDREIWASVGVLVGGAITSTVLVFNLPAADDSATGRMLTALNEVGEPAYLTLRQLVREPARWLCHGKTIYICENPAIVAEAAAALGADCKPLICTQGQPRAATATLLNQLRRSGARLLYHGDFDWAGIHIGNTMMRRFMAQPWRFDAVDYQAARQRRGQPLRGKAVAACWDVGLMPAMQARNKQLEEEQVITDLLDDLAL